MNAPADHEATAYVADVLLLYLQLPETPLRAGVPDQGRARRWHDLGVPLHVVESAFLLGSLRRLLRPSDAAPLSPIRSLAYFQPVLDELIANPPPDNYLDYLRLKLRRLAAAKAVPAGVQKTTFPDDR
jgi:hypothetical protein